MANACDERVAIVTGAGRGIGREYALLLAEQGAKVVVNDLGGTPDGTGSDIGPAHEVVAEIKAAGGEAVANGADVSDWAQAKAMIDQAVSTYGKLDVLINNAGILRDRMLVNMSEGEWDAVINVHLKGTFAPTHHAAAHWRDLSKRTGAPVNARIINTSSNSGIYGNIGQSNYGAAKAGIAGLTIIAARELARYGVTVNAIAPVALTRLTEGLVPVTEERKVRNDPRWVAAVGVWLAGADTSDVTARVFEVGAGTLAVAEGWRRGPATEPIADLEILGPTLRDMMAKARKNVDMWAKELD